MVDHDGVRAFEEARPALIGLAYRILGTRADAEDAVQDAFLKWQQAERDQIDNPAAWLRTICTRRCIDLLRSAHRTRVEYVGAWLPEPIHTPIEHHAENASAMASSLTTAFMLMLERLTPKERAAYLLHEIFDVSYPEIAATLDMQESACRKLVSRARTNIEQAKVRHTTPLDRQEQLLAAFEAAVARGNTDQLVTLLSDDIELAADGGGKVAAILHVLHGKADVLDFIKHKLRPWWGDYRWIPADLNGGRGVVLQKDGETIAAISFAYDEAGAATNIYIMRNPDKLARLSGTVGA
jgi:RNA polymerase sigma factor (sigma-70 family)